MQKQILQILFASLGRSSYKAHPDFRPQFDSGVRVWLTFARDHIVEGYLNNSCQRNTLLTLIV